MSAVEPACPACGDPGYRDILERRYCGNPGCEHTDELPEADRPRDRLGGSPPSEPKEGT